MLYGAHDKGHQAHHKNDDHMHGADKYLQQLYGTHDGDHTAHHDNDDHMHGADKYLQNLCLQMIL